METILFIRGFNNYNNRKVKIASTKSEFQSQSDTVYEQTSNFNPNDGVEAKITVGGPSFLDFEAKGDPDYLAVYTDGYGGTSNGLY